MTSHIHRLLYSFDVLLRVGLGVEGRHLRLFGLGFDSGLVGGHLVVVGHGAVGVRLTPVSKDGVGHTEEGADKGLAETLIGESVQQWVYL